MKKVKNNSKSGMVLAMVMIVMMLVTIMGMGLFSYSERRLVTITRSLDRARSLWLAEGGRQYIKAVAVANPLPLPKILNATQGIGSVINFPGGGICSNSCFLVTGTTSLYRLYCTGATPAGSQTVIGTYAWADSLNRWGWGMTTGATWELNDTSNNKTDNTSVINWGGDNRIMGPFFAGDCLSIKTDKAPNLCFGGEVVAYNFYDSSWSSNPAGMKSDSDNNDGNKGVSDELLNSLLLKGYTRTWGDERYSMSLVENYNSLRGNATKVIGGAVNEAATPDNLVYEVEFLASGGLRYRPTTAVLVADINQGMYDRNSGNPLKLDVDGDGRSDGSTTGHYSSLDDIKSDLKNGVKKDLNVFLDIDFIPAGAGDWTTIPSFNPDGDVISVNGDAYVHGQLDGKVTLVSEKNIFIGGDGVVYKSAMEHEGANWQDWTLNGKTLGTLANSPAGIDEEAMKAYVDKNIDDMLGLVTRHQVAVLDNADNKPVNVHATITISEDVDTQFARGYDVTLGAGYDIQLSTATRAAFEEAKADPVTYYGKKDDKGAWGTVQTTPDSGLTKIPAAEAAYVWKSGSSTKLASEADVRAKPSSYKSFKSNGNSYGSLIANPINYICANGWLASNKSLPDYFYKQYCTVGFHPWGMRKSSQSNANSEMGDLNLFGGMSEYRHSRFNPNNSGMHRKFLYDWRFLKGQAPPGYIGTGYAFVGWQIVNQK